MKKENYEWIYAWQDENFKHDLPRVLLIGDSITNYYQAHVRQFLQGFCYVDYVSTTFSIDTKIYRDLIKNYARYNDYDLVHYNFGLHGKHLSEKSYKTKVDKIIEFLSEKSKVVLANTTVVYENGNKVLDKSWMKRVSERNRAMKEIAEERGLPIDNLYSVSCDIPKSMRYIDGTHYTIDGYKELAQQVARFIRNNL